MIRAFITRDKVRTAYSHSSPDSQGSSHQAHGCNDSSNNTCVKHPSQLLGSEPRLVRNASSHHACSNHGCYGSCNRLKYKNIFILFIGIIVEGLFTIERAYVRVTVTRDIFGMNTQSSSNYFCFIKSILTTMFDQAGINT